MYFNSLVVFITLHFLAPSFFCHTLYLLADFLFAHEIILKGFLSFTGPFVGLGVGLAVGLGVGFGVGFNVGDGVTTGSSDGSADGMADGVTDTAGPVIIIAGPVGIMVTDGPVDGYTVSSALYPYRCCTVCFLATLVIIFAVADGTSAIINNSDNAVKKHINFLLDFFI